MRRLAFTILELLIVIAIIAILAALLFPVLARAKKNALATGDISNMRQLYAGVVLYESDYDDVSPKTLYDIKGYVKEQRVFASALDPRPLDRIVPDWTKTPLRTKLYDTRSPFRISYPYLRTFMSDGGSGPFSYASRRLDPLVGMLANPWVGEIDHWTSNVVDGETEASTFGPIMYGAIQRIKMDGSLFILPRRHITDCLGGCTDDLFFYPPKH